MKKTCSKILLCSALLDPIFNATASDIPYITPEQAVDLALTPKLKVQGLTKNATKAELVGLNKSIHRIDAVRRQMLGQNAPEISAEILNGKDTPEDVEAKINAILGNNAQPEDFVHLMEPPAIDVQEETNSETTPAQEENMVTPQEPLTTTQPTHTLKDVIIEEEDSSTKHIYRGKVFTKQ